MSSDICGSALSPARKHRGRRALGGVGLAATLMVSMVATTGVANATPATLNTAPDFGSNAIVFDPSMPTSQIQATVDAIATQQISNQFGTQRYALLFKPAPTDPPPRP